MSIGRESIDRSKDKQSLKNPIFRQWLSKQKYIQKDPCAYAGTLHMSSGNDPFKKCDFTPNAIDFNGRFSDIGG